MNKISCDLCLDLMPLVRDGVACEDSKQAVAQHLEQCESCRSIWKGGPAPLPEKDAALRRTAKKLNLVWSFLLMLCMIAGLELTAESGVFYNTLVMPLAGILGYLVFQKGAYIHTPVLLLATHFIVNLLRSLRETETLDVGGLLFYTFIYALFLLLGVGLANFVHFLFSKSSAGKRLRPKKLLAGIGAAAILVFLCINAEMLCGNPVSKAIVQHRAEQYLAEHHPECRVDDVFYDFKFSRYGAHASKPGSMDVVFSVYFNRFGEMQYDEYDFEVKNGFCVYRRLNDAYRQMAQPVTENPVLQQEVPFEFCTASLNSFSRNEDGSLPPDAGNALDRTALVPDAIYNIRQLGADYGSIYCSVKTDDLSPEHAAAILLKLRDSFDRAGVPFASLSLSLSDVPPEESAQDAPRRNLWVDGIAYDDIRPEGLAGRVRDAAAAKDEVKKDVP